MTVGKIDGQVKEQYVGEHGEVCSGCQHSGFYELVMMLF